MMTSRASPLSPTRGGRVSWSQHTSYPAAVGVHSEVSSTARCLHLTGRQQLTADLASLTSLHHKELRRLQRQRKALQASMVAYAHKMKEISDEKLSANSPTFRHHLEASQSKGGSFSVRRKGWRSADSEKGQTYVNSVQSESDRVMNHNKTGHSAETRPESRPRISVDSGIDVTEAWVEEPRREVRQRGSLPSVGTVSREPVQHPPRPSSFHATVGKQEEKERQPTQRGPAVSKPRPASFPFTSTPDLSLDPVQDHTSTVFSTATKPRQRRQGTSENPAVLFQKFVTQKNHSRKGNLKLDNGQFLSSSPEAEGTLPSISPFPEFKEASKLAAAEKGLLGIPVQRKHQAQVPSPIPLSPSKLKKTKELYLHLKKMQRERQVEGRTSKSLKKHTRQPLPSSSSPRQKGVGGRQKGMVKPQPSRQTFHRSFRYSDAVESLLKSFDDCQLDRNDQRRIRKAAELLPALDIEDLRQERREKQCRNKTDKTNFLPSRQTSSHDVLPSVHGNEDTDDVINEVTDDDIIDDEGVDTGDERSDVRSDYGSDDDSEESYGSFEDEEIMDSAK